MKGKLRVKIQDEEEQYPDIAKAENYNKDEVIKNQDEIIENQASTIVDLKMKLSALKKEYEIASKQNAYMRIDIDKFRASENIKYKDAYDSLKMQYIDLEYKYNKLQERYNEVWEEKRKIIEQVSGVMSNSVFDVWDNFISLMGLLDIEDDRFYR